MNQIINKNSITNMCLSVIGNTTIEGAVYLFSFTHTVTLNEKTCIIPDTGRESIKPLWSVFDLTESGQDDALNGVLSLEPGDYIYRIYEQSSSTNLNPSGQPIEIGMAYVVGNTIDNKEYSPDIPKNKVYNG